MEIEIGSFYKHLKSGGIYKVTGFGTIEETMQPCVFYEHAPRDRMGTWVRPLGEFGDGRFELWLEPKAPPEAPYGYCPWCGAMGETRERRPNGDDHCVNGHSYPSRDALPTPPVNREARVLVSGAPVPDDHSHTALKENGQQKDYIVLSAEERAKGFVRPVRRTYLHVGENPRMEGIVLIAPDKGACGSRTTMSQEIAETYARDPYFYSGTFCCSCGKHLPIGKNGEFIWEGTTEKVGT